MRTAGTGTWGDILKSSQDQFLFQVTTEVGKHLRAIGVRSPTPNGQHGVGGQSGDRNGTLVTFYLWWGEPTEIQGYYQVGKQQRAIPSFDVTQMSPSEVVLHATNRNVFQMLDALDAQKLRQAGALDTQAVRLAELRAKQAVQLPSEEDKGKPSYDDDFKAGFVAGKAAYAKDDTVSKSDADKAYKKVQGKHGTWWTDGYTAAIDIGRGATSTTPAQIARKMKLAKGASMNDGTDMTRLAELRLERGVQAAASNQQVAFAPGLVFLGKALKIEHILDKEHAEGEKSSPPEYRGKTAASDMGFDLLYGVVNAAGIQHVRQALTTAKDTESLDLLKKAMSLLADKLSPTSNEEQAIDRLRSLAQDGDRWSADLIRNNVFKIANSLKLALPSGMFASQERTADYKPEGEVFADLLKKKWNGVKYNIKANMGFASVGRFKITFYTSGDSGVILNFSDMPRLKTTPEMAAEALVELGKLWSKYDAG